MNTSDEIFKKAIGTYGKDYQTGVAMEECAELTQAVSKCRRYGGVGKYRENLIEEIADVRICIEQLMIMYGISADDVAEIEGLKILRIMQRLGDKCNA